MLRHLLRVFSIAVGPTRSRKNVRTFLRLLVFCGGYEESRGGCLGFNISEKTCKKRVSKRKNRLNRRLSYNLAELERLELSRRVLTDLLP